jgi:outer membrane immunogenic protein
MRRLQCALLATAAVIGFTSIASAADMPAKAPVYKAAPVAMYNWTGFYIGGNVGSHWSNVDISTSTTNLAFFAAAAPGVIDATSPTSLRASGVIGGLQVGYNWQWGQYVTGIEVDANWLGGSTSRTLTAFPAPVVAGDFETNSATAIFLVTVRPRFGVVFDRALIYVTGGLAFARIDTTDTFAAGAGLNIQTVSASTNRTGWTIGGGLEYALTNNWSVKGEYLYADLGSFSTVGPDFTAGAGTHVTYNHKYRENIARLGVNYKF